jgi:hypothetical protein
MVHANQAQKPEHINRNRRTRHGCVLGVGWVGVGWGGDAMDEIDGYTTRKKYIR